MVLKNEVSTSQIDSKSGLEIRRIANLALGDLMAFAVFTIIGINNHKVGLTISHFVVTVVPFLIGWFVISPWFGVYRRDITENRGKMVQRTALAWLVSLPVCLAIRGMFFEHAVPQPSFALVAFISNLVFLLIWRLPYTWAKNRKHTA